MKYLLVLVVVVFGFLLLKRQFLGKPRSNDAKQSKADDPRTLRETEPMMRCAHCGVFMPRSMSVQIQGRHYCSKEHAKAAEEASVRSGDKDKKG